MYESKNVRAISWGLILSVVYMIIAAIVAVIDPFKNGVPWVNWLTLSVVMVISATVVTWITSEIDSDGEFWGWVGLAVSSWLVAGGVVGSMVTAPNNGILPEYHALVWTTFAVPFVTLPVTALIQYLVGAAAHSHQGSVSELHQHRAA